MKTITLMSVIALVFIAQSANAQVPMPGGSSSHLLNCTIPESPNGSKLLGMGYALKCETRAVAPQHSLVGCHLITKVVYPGAKPRVSPLKMMKQDEDYAQLADDSKSIRVTLTKINMSAVLRIGSSAKSICTTAKE